MNPFRAYKTKHDFMRDDTSISTLPITINLFDVHAWMQCDNEDQGFRDEVLRTEVIAGQNNSFYLRVPYKDFDKVMLDFYRQYGLLDANNITPPPVPDKHKYTGPMQAAVQCSKNEMHCVFHRKGFVPDSLEEAVFNCLFSNTTPMN